MPINKGKSEDLKKIEKNLKKVLTSKYDFVSINKHRTGKANS